MSTNKVFSDDNLIVGDDGLCTENQQQARERIIFELALALATEPSKPGQLRQMLVHLQQQREIPEEFSLWAIGQLDERVTSFTLFKSQQRSITLPVKDGVMDLC